VVRAIACYEMALDRADIQSSSKRKYISIAQAATAVINRDVCNCLYDRDWTLSSAALMWRVDGIEWIVAGVMM